MLIGVLLYFRCSSTQTVPLCGRSIYFLLKATSAASQWQRSTHHMESVWARSALWETAAWCLTQLCLESRTTCWVKHYYLWLSVFFSTIVTMGVCFILCPDIFIQQCHFLRQSGHSEKAVSLFQAMMDFTYFKPDSVKNLPTKQQVCTWAHYKRKVWKCIQY